MTIESAARHAAWLPTTHDWQGPCKRNACDAGGGDQVTRGLTIKPSRTTRHGEGGGPTDPSGCLRCRPLLDQQSDGSVGYADGDVVVLGEALLTR